MIGRALLTSTFIALTCAQAFAASAATFGQIDLPSTLAPQSQGHDSGVAFSGNEHVRISASGRISLANSRCASAITPLGCPSSDFAVDNQAASVLKDGTLMAEFTDASNQPVTPWFAVGTYVSTNAPSRAAHLIYRLSDVNAPGTGTFHIVTDIAPASTAVIRGRLSVGRSTGAKRGIRSIATAVDPSTTYEGVAYFLRRFGFSDTPANIQAIVKAGGAGPWLDAQLAAGSTGSEHSDVQPVGRATLSQRSDQYYYQHREYDLLMASQWPVLQKVTLHWLEHFSVGYPKVAAPFEVNGATMGHYQEMVRKDALGNFKTLLSDILQEPAMLIWLDNDSNNGSVTAGSPPTENLAREAMQLYAIGPWLLHSDATQYTSNGSPEPAYSDLDVQQIALALSGFKLGRETGGLTPFHNQSMTTVFTPAIHAPNTSYNIIDQYHSFTDPGNAVGNTTHAQCAWSVEKGPDHTKPCVVDNLVADLATTSEIAPFESKELIERFANENPSPGYIYRVAQVWQKTANDPNQIAEVIKAVATDPEFYKSEYTTVKEPVEFAMDAVHALGGAHANSWVDAQVYGQIPTRSLEDSIADDGQDLWSPESVFSFYLPGPPPNGKESMLDTGSLLGRWRIASQIGGYPFGGCPVTSACNSVNLGLEKVTLNGKTINHLSGSSTDITALANYLIEALLGVSDASEYSDLQALVVNYLGNGAEARVDSASPGPGNLTRAIYIILSSPEYEVN